MISFFDDVIVMISLILVMPTHNEGRLIVWTNFFLKKLHKLKKNIKGLKAKQQFKDIISMTFILYLISSNKSYFIQTLNNIVKETYLCANYMRACWYNLASPKKKMLV